jgi:hypothetical protein
VRCTLAGASVMMHFGIRALLEPSIVAYLCENVASAYEKLCLTLLRSTQQTLMSCLYSFYWERL